MRMITRCQECCLRPPPGRSSGRSWGSCSSCWGGAGRCSPGSAPTLSLCARPCRNIMITPLHTISNLGRVWSCIITEKDPTRAFSLFKAATNASIFKNLLRCYAKHALTHGKSRVDRKLGPQHYGHKGWAALRHFAKVHFKLYTHTCLACSARGRSPGRASAHVWWCPGVSEMLYFVLLTLNN